MDLLTSWRHKSSIFVLVNYHCHLMDSHTFWGQYICISKLPLAYNRFTYFLKTQGHHICISKLPLSFDESTDFLKTQEQYIWIGELPLSFDGLTYFLKKQEQYIWISKLPLSFNRFTYILPEDTITAYLCYWITIVIW